MVYAKFTHTYDEVTTNKVTQWDYGRTLRIEGLKLPSVVRIDFCISGEQTTIARIGTTKDNVTDVVIPDSLLEQAQTIVAYVYLNDTTTGKTVKTINIPVVARPKPEEHDTPESKELFAEAIEVVNEIANRVEEDKSATKTYSDSAKESLESTIKAKNEAVKEIQEEGATQIEALQGFASAIKGNVTGNVIKVDDISSVEHDLKVKVDGATRVSRYGKNLWNLQNELILPSMLSYDDATQIYTANSTGIIQPVLTFDNPLPVGTKVAVTLKILDGEFSKGGISVGGYHTGDVNSWQGYVTITGLTGSLANRVFTDTYTATETITDLIIFIDGSAVLVNPIKFKVQFELSETATEYEPHKKVQTAEVAEDGTVTSLTSVSPNMTILADTEGAMIECEYNIDTKTYIDRKIAELMME